LREKEGYHVVVVRSTVPPGTVMDRLIPILSQNSGREAGRDFGVCMNPEFLREGSAIKDFHQPGYTIIGELDARSGDTAEGMYCGVDAPVYRSEIAVAEMTKYVSNAYHALKIVFANEIGTLCKTAGVDGQEVMNLFCKDQHLNISAAYLRPGFAFGGSCLPKDVRAINYWAKERDVPVPVLGAILASNQGHLQRAIELVEKSNRERIGILGLSFKPATDDVRESPTIALIESLVGRGYQVAVYDDLVDPKKLIGANRVFLERALPHIASLMRTTLDEIVQEAEVIVITNSSPRFQTVAKQLREDQVLIDLTGIAKDVPDRRGAYEGICW
jgi:GDP-mannose 6-dehydrogenase